MPAMDRTVLGKTDLSVSRLGFGDLAGPRGLFLLKRGQPQFRKQSAITIIARIGRGQQFVASEDRIRPR